jgi:flagellin
MLFSVNTNPQALNALNYLNRTTNSLGQVFDKISSGLRITKAGDDAAGLGMADALQSNSIYRQTAINNGVAATAMLTTADSALDKVANTLTRMRQSAMQPSLSTDLANGAVDSVRAGLVQDPTAALQAQAGQSPDRAMFLLR